MKSTYYPLISDLKMMSNVDSSGGTERILLEVDTFSDGTDTSG